MDAFGITPMPWQRYVLDVALEVHPITGNFVYRDVGLSVPRQQGKTALLLGVQAHRLMAFVRQNIMYAAQTRESARKKWTNDFVESMELRFPGKFKARLQPGSEELTWLANRSRWAITANTEKASHGETLDLGVIDEAFAHEDFRLDQAFGPAMITRPNAQKWWLSAGGTERSVYLNTKREIGRDAIEKLWRTGEYPAIAYFEWFASEDMPRDDPKTWWSCMPALGYTVTEPVIRSELESMEPAEFDRAYLNRTKRSIAAPDENVPSVEWPTRADQNSQAGPDVALAIDITPRRNSAAIGLYSLRDDDMGHLEVIDYREGTDWVVPAIAKLKGLLNPIAIAVDSYGPGGTLVLDLEKAGITRPKDPDRPERGDLIIASGRDVGDACANLSDAVRQSRLVHIDQAELNSAVGGTRTRSFGDGMYAWARKSGGTDISPLMATTLAMWAFEQRAHLIVSAEPMIYRLGGRSVAP